MRHATIDGHGFLSLNGERDLGFRPGTVVEIIATRAGSLILVPAETVPIEAAYRVSAARRMALSEAAEGS